MARKILNYFWSALFKDNRRGEPVRHNVLFGHDKRFARGAANHRVLVRHSEHEDFAESISADDLASDYVVVVYAYEAAFAFHATFNSVMLSARLAGVIAQNAATSAAFTKPL